MYTKISTNMTQLQEYIADNRVLLEGVDILLIEQIFEAGRIAERSNVLELISNGTLTVTPDH